MKFLLSPKWIAFTLIVILSLPAFDALSQWQWRRLHQRQDFNTQIEQAQARPAVSLKSLVKLSGKNVTVRGDAQWRSVGVSGYWDMTHQVLVRKKSFESDMGFWVITPLVQSNGVAVLVNRGWTPAKDSALHTPDVMTPPQGLIHITGRIRIVNSSGPAQPTDLPRGQVNTIVPKQIVSQGQVLGNAYLEMTASRPQSLTSDLKQIDPPEISEGPHRSYALQWIFFAIMTVIGWAILVRNEYLDRLTQSTESAN